MQKDLPNLKSLDLFNCEVTNSEECRDKVFEMLSETTALRDRLEENTRYFRTAMTRAGFDIKEGDHPIAPVMLGDARLAAEMADDLLAEGIYVIGFSFPVVPRGEARIRVQLSAGHSPEEVERIWRQVKADEKAQKAARRTES